MIDLFVKGGFAMYPLLALSVVTLAIAIERMVYLRKAQIDTGKFMEAINGFLTRNALEEAYRFCESTSGPISRIIKAGLKNQKRGPRRRHPIDRGRRGDRGLPVGARDPDHPDDLEDRPPHRPVRHGDRHDPLLPGDRRRRGGEPEDWSPPGSGRRSSRRPAGSWWPSRRTSSPSIS